MLIYNIWNMVRSVYYLYCLYIVQDRQHRTINQMLEAVTFEMGLKGGWVSAVWGGCSRGREQLLAKLWKESASYSLENPVFPFIILFSLTPSSLCVCLSFFLSLSLLSPLSVSVVGPPRWSAERQWWCVFSGPFSSPSAPSWPPLLCSWVLPVLSSRLASLHFPLFSSCRRTCQTSGFAPVPRLSFPAIPCVEYCMERWVTCDNTLLLALQINWNVWNQSFTS